MRVYLESGAEGPKHVTRRITVPPAELTTRHVRIMLLLADEACHGYVISQRLEEETNGRIVLRPGSLYRALHQLLERGLIRELNNPGEDPRRRMYELTTPGRKALATELSGMGDLVIRGRKLGVVKKA